MGNRRPLADRLAELTPVHREQHGATVILCELIDELIAATDRQSALLAASLDQSAGQRDGHHRDGRTPAVPAPTEAHADAPQGVAAVQLREPALPPPDPDPTPARGAVADPPAAPAAAARRPAKKATAAKKPTTQKAPQGGRAGTA